MTVQGAFEGEDWPRALIVSDDDVLGDLLALNLRRRHVLVERVSARQEGRSEWMAHLAPPAVIVVNIERATTNTLALLTEIGALPDLANVPVVLAVDNASAIAARYRGGVNVYPAKPDDVRTIIATTIAIAKNLQHADDSGRAN